VKHNWGEKEHTECYSQKETNWIAWMKAGTWKLRGITGGRDKVFCPQCLGK
jgi:hypothetical protein